MDWGPEHARALRQLLELEGSSQGLSNFNREDFNPYAACEALILVLGRELRENGEVNTARWDLLGQAVASFVEHFEREASIARGAVAMVGGVAPWAGKLGGARHNTSNFRTLQQHLLAARTAQDQHGLIRRLTDMPYGLHRMSETFPLAQ